MLSALKEGLKNWLMAHERLYWYIVIGLAVLLFGLITAVGCGKVRTAEAAIEGVDYAEVLSVAQAHMTDKCGATYIDDYPYYVMIDYVEKNRVNVLFMRDKLTPRNDNSLAGFPYSFSSSAYYVRVYFDDLHIDDLATSYSCCFTGLDAIAYCNYDVMYNGSVVKYAEEPVATGTAEFIYLVNAPYVAFDFLEIANPVGTGEYYTSDISDLYWEYHGTVEGQPMVAQEYHLKCTLTVKLPSVSYVDWFSSQYDYWESVKKDIPLSVLRWGGEARKDPANYDLFLLPFDKYLDVGEDGTFTIKVDAGDVYAAILDRYGKLYDDGELALTEEQIKTRYLPFVFSHMYIESMDSVLYTRIDDETVYYGRYVQDNFEFGTTNRCVTVEVSEDILNTAEDKFLEILRENTAIAYGDAISAVLDKNAELQDTLKNIYAGNNAYSDLGSSDLWGYAKSTADGLLGSLGTITALAGIVSILFSFIPVATTGVISTVFVVGLICAIISFVRGK